MVVTVYGGYGVVIGMGEDMPAAMELPDIGTSIGVMAVYLAVFFILSIWIAKRREML